MQGVDLKGASEPSANLAPRLDRRDKHSLGPRVISSCLSASDKRRVPHRRARRCLLKGCEQCVHTGSSAKPLLQSYVCGRGPALAAGAGEPALSGQRRRVASGGGSSIGVIGSGGASGRRQLDERRRARASAQRRRSRFLASGCAIGRAATSRFAVPHEHSCQRFCSVACRLALRRVLDREARYRQRRRRWRRQRVTQALSARRTPREACLCALDLVVGQRKVPRPQNGGRSGRS